MYDCPPGHEALWSFGAWVNGGHWSTCEARMILAYYRLGKFEDARKSMRQLMTFARKFRMDNPLAKFGSEITQPKEPINLCYDTLGPAAALIRGLFEYLYNADNLTLIPHIPPTITELHQKDPIRFGKKKIFLSTLGTGPISVVSVNGKRWSEFSAESVTLPFDRIPDVAHIRIVMGNQKIGEFSFENMSVCSRELPVVDPSDLPEPLIKPEARIRKLAKLLSAKGLSDSYEAAHAALFLESLAAILQRQKIKAHGHLTILPGPSQEAADQSYIAAAQRLYDGFEKLMASYGESKESRRIDVYEIWKKSEL